MDPFREPGDRLHVALRRVLEATPARSVPLSAVLDGVSGPAHGVALLLLALPFLQPMPTLGLAYPIGLAIAALGLAVAFGRRPGVPLFVSRRHVRRELLHGMALVAERAARLLPARARLGFMLAPLPRCLAGLSLACAGLLLFLPIPLPLSNFVPAVAILLLASGLLEGDGVLVAAGHLANAGSCLLLYASWSVLAERAARLIAIGLG
jgi:hypothetical protein